MTILSSISQLKLRQPDDWHIHLRAGSALKQTVADVARVFARAIVMPNLKSPITNVTMAKEYRQQICAHIPAKKNFTPLMTLYLTETTTPMDVHLAAESGVIHAFKYYPAHATTHSEFGVSHLLSLPATLAALQEVQMPLLLHGESTKKDVDVFDREAYFIEHELKPLLAQFPHLRLVLEHITTADAVNFIMDAKANIAATITAHHLLLNRNDLLAGGIRPHYYCAPILKRARHQAALIQAATSGSPKFFLGSDSAPHAIDSKENACGCAGIYTQHAAIELYAEVFAAADQLARLENFASVFGAQFYGLPLNQQSINLVKRAWRVPAFYPYADTKLVPLRAGEMIEWTVV